jgi:hypothetical protein
MLVPVAATATNLRMVIMPPRPEIDGSRVFGGEYHGDVAGRTLGYPNATAQPEDEFQPGWVDSESLKPRCQTSEELDRAIRARLYELQSQGCTILGVQQTTVVSDGLLIYGARITYRLPNRPVDDPMVDRPGTVDVSGHIGR